MNWHYVSEKGKEIESGEKDLSVLIEKGLVKSDTEVWREGMGAWTTAGTAAPGKFRSSKLRPGGLPPQDTSPLPKQRVEESTPVQRNPKNEAPSRKEAETKKHASGVSSVGFKANAQKALRRVDNFDDDSDEFVRPAIGMFCVVGYFIYRLYKSFANGKPPFFDTVLDVGLVVLMLVVCMVAAFIGWVLTKKFRWGTEIGFLLMFALIIKSQFFGVESYIESFRPVTTELQAATKMEKMRGLTDSMTNQWKGIADAGLLGPTTASRIEGRAELNRVFSQFRDALTIHEEKATAVVEADLFNGEGVSDEQMEKKARIADAYRSSAVKMQAMWSGIGEELLSQLKVNQSTESTISDIKRDLRNWRDEEPVYQLAKDLWDGEVAYATSLSKFGQLMERSAGEWSFSKEEKRFSFEDSQGKTALDAVIKKIRQTQVNYSRTRLELLHAL